MKIGLPGLCFFLAATAQFARADGTGSGKDSSAIHVPDNPRLALWARSVKNSVEDKWKLEAPPDSAGAAKAVVTFVVRKYGQVAHVALVSDRSPDSFSEHALNAVRSLTYVSPIPSAFPEDSIFVTYEFLLKCMPVRK